MKRRTTTKIERIAAFFLLIAIGPAAWAGTVAMFDTHYRPLTDVAGFFGMAYSEPEPGESALLESRWTQLQFEQHKRHAFLNGYKVDLGHPVVVRNGRFYIGETDFRSTLQPILTPQVFATVPKLEHIVVDAGHGGHDPGAVNRTLGLDEKMTTLDLAYRLRDKLQAHGYRVTLTRSDNTYVGLSERAALANRLGADLFISVHFNAATSDAEGAETFILTPVGAPSSSSARLGSGDYRFHRGNRQDAWNALAGFYIQREIVNALPVVDRGLRRARFAVLKPLEMPGVLVEGGFLSHPREARLIGWAQYRDDLANAIVGGVNRYHRTLLRLRGVE